MVPSVGGTGPRDTSYQWDWRDNLLTSPGLLHHTTNVADTTTSCRLKQNILDATNRLRGDNKSSLIINKNESVPSYFVKEKQVPVSSCHFRSSCESKRDSLRNCKNILKKNRVRNYTSSSSIGSTSSTPRHPCGVALHESSPTLHPPPHLTALSLQPPTLPRYSQQLFRETLGTDASTVNTVYYNNMSYYCSRTMACVSPVLNYDSSRDLFENEHGSDVSLLVGAAGTEERVPAHSWVLAHNDYFKSLLRNTKEREIYFREDQPRSFRNFIRWLYTGQYSPKDISSALNTLQVSTKYKSLDLSEHIFNYLSLNLNPENVLLIMAWGHRYTTSNTCLSPTAPPLSQLDDKPPPYSDSPPPYDEIYDSDTNSDSCRLLVDACLRLLDARADEALASEALEELSSVLLSAVLSRDSLGVSSEVVVLDTLYRWSNAECRRQHQTLTMASRRLVLGQMLTLPRLLTLSRDKLHVLDHLYEKQEKEFISCVVSKISDVPPVPPLFAECLPQLSLLRKLPTSEQYREADKSQKKTGKKSKLNELGWDLICGFARIFD